MKNARARSLSTARRPTAAPRWTALVVILALPAANISAAETWALHTPRGVTQPVLIEAPDRPKAALVLFAGGDGGVIFANDSPTTYRGNFLVRSRAAFLKSGFVVATLGAASDRTAPTYLDDDFRKSKEHADDTRTVIDALRKQFGVPVWLVGTSRGTFSAAAVGLHLGKAVDGIVLTSTMADVIDLPVDRFEVPVLMVHHERDGCRETYYREAKRTAARIKAPRTELVPVSGGKDEGKPCLAMAYHGFNGIEADVVSVIANWILKP